MLLNPSNGSLPTCSTTQTSTPSGGVGYHMTAPTLLQDRATNHD
jgi:hypothetical protein